MRSNKRFTRLATFFALVLTFLASTGWAQAKRNIGEFILYSLGGQNELGILVTPYVEMPVILFRSIDFQTEDNDTKFTLNIMPKQAKEREEFSETFKFFWLQRRRDYFEPFLSAKMGETGTLIPLPLHIFDDEKSKNLIASLLKSPILVQKLLELYQKNGFMVNHGGFPLTNKYGLWLYRKFLLFEKDGKVGLAWSEIQEDGKKKFSAYFADRSTTNGSTLSEVIGIETTR